MSHEATRLAEELRDACMKIRVKASIPLSSLIPLMQRAADLLDSPAQPAVGEEAERVAFEAWEYGRGGNVTRHDSGVYANSTMQGRWTVWLARAQSSAKGDEA